MAGNNNIKDEFGAEDIVALSGADQDVNIVQVGGAAIALGQTTMAGSFPVVIASDQSAIPVTISGGSSSIQYTEGDTDASITGTAIMWEDTADTLRSVSAAKPLPVDIKNTTLAVTQSGTWNIDTLGTITNVVHVDDNGSSITVDGTVAISGSIDTELPSAVALADDTANPTVPAVGSFLMGYNRVNNDWDRVNVSRTNADGLASHSAGNLVVQARGIWYNGTTWDRARGDATNGLLVNLGSNNDVVVSGTVAATQSGTWVLGSNSGVDIGDVTINNAAGASAVNIQDGGNSITVDGTIAATQSGTWNINNISGTISLPTGAATEATLADIKTSVQLIDDAIYTDGTGTVTKGIAILGQDGTNPQAIKTDSNGELQVDVLTMPTVTVQATNLDIRDLTSASDNVEIRTAAGVALNLDGSGDVQVDVKTIAAGDNTIGRVKLTDGTDVADIFDLANSNPLTVAIVDGSGDQITSFGGGTQYTEDAAAAANPVGTVPILVRTDTPATQVSADGDNIAQRATNYGAAYVQVVTSAGAYVDTFGGGTQYTEGDTDASITGTAMMWEDAADTLRAVSAAKPLPVGDAGGSLTIDNATLSVVGGGVEATALRVTIASDSTGVLSVDDNGGSLTIDAASLPLPTGASTLAEQQTQTTALQLIDNLVLAEDAAHITADPGVQMLAVRKATPANLSGTDGDYEPLQISAGRVWASATIDAALPAGTNNIGDVDVLSIAAGDNNIGNVDIVTVPAPLSTTGGGTEATALRVTIASDSTGVLSVDDNGSTLSIDDGGGTITVDGTVAATQSGTWNIKLQDGDSSVVADVLDLTNSNPLTVAIVDTNGDQISSFGGGTQYTEDAAAAANPVGTALNLVRDDARGGSLTTTDGDNVAARGTNAGELYVKHVDTIPVTQSGTWNITNISGTVSLPTGAATETTLGAVKTSVELIDDAIVADDAAFTPATTKVMMAGFEYDDSTPDSVNEGDAGAARMSANRNIYTTIRDAAGNERGVNVNSNNTLAISLDGQTSTITVQAQQATAASLNAMVIGPLAHGVADNASYRPLKGAVHASTTAPTAVDADDVANMWGDLNGRLNIQAWHNTAKDGTGTAYIPIVDTDGHLQVDVLSGGIASTQYTEDAASAGAESLMLAGAVRRDTAASSSGTDGDYSTINVDATGRLWTHVGTIDGGTITTITNVVHVDDNAGSLTVDNAGTFAVQATIAAGATAIAKAEDVASADADVGVPAMAVRKATPANTSGTDGDYEFLQMSAGRLWTSSTIDAALPAGTNAIGKLAANSGVDIGDVDVTSIVPGTGATNLGKAEDAAHTTGDTGVMVLTVRKDTAAALAGTDGDYAPPETNARGATWVAIEDGAGGQITSFGGGTEYTEDAASAADPTGPILMARRRDAPASEVSADGDNIALNATSKGALYISPIGGSMPVDDNGSTISIDDGSGSITVDGTLTVNDAPTSSGGYTKYHLISAASTNATNIKASAGQVYGWSIYNSATSHRKVAFHDNSGSPTAGASIYFTVHVPPLSVSNIMMPAGTPFSSGIAITTVTDIADAGTTAVGANDLGINIFYK